jgi:hypothetical protein
MMVCLLSINIFNPAYYFRDTINSIPQTLQHITAANVKLHARFVFWYAVNAMPAMLNKVDNVPKNNAANFISLTSFFNLFYSSH